MLWYIEEDMGRKKIKGILIRMKMIWRIIAGLAIAIPIFFYFFPTIKSEVNDSKDIIFNICIILIIIYILFEIILNFSQKEFFKGAYSTITSDGTKIIRDKMSISKMEFEESCKIKKHLYIALSVSSIINIVHLSILAKLKQLQNYNFKPFIFLTQDPSLLRYDKREKNRFEQRLRKLIDFYLRDSFLEIKGYEILDINKYNLWKNKNMMEILSKWTLQDIKSSFHKQVEINDTTPLSQFFLPVIEFLCLHRHSKTAILCGSELLPLWTLISKKMDFSSTIFLLPELVNFNNERAHPREEKNTFNINHTTREEIEQEIENVTSFTPLLQLYYFFLFPICSKKDFLIKSYRGSEMKINSVQDLNLLIENNSLTLKDLKMDLIERIPDIMIKINKRIQ